MDGCVCPPTDSDPQLHVIASTVRIIDFPLSSSLWFLYPLTHVLHISLQYSSALRLLLVGSLLALEYPNIPRKLRCEMTGV